MAADGDVDFDECMSWLLPAHILHEACTHVNHGEHRRSGKKYHTRPRYPYNKALVGPMQAVFLEPPHKTSGTGVFLPRKAGTDLRPSKKPACSPVLLPYRVVQALKLDVHALGLQISPREDEKIKQQGVNVKDTLASNKDAKDLSVDCAMNSGGQTCSAEVLLPQEWSY